MLVFSFKLPPPTGTPSYPRGRVVYLVFEDRRVQNISRIKIYRTPIKYKMELICLPDGNKKNKEYSFYTILLEFIIESID